MFIKDCSSSWNDIQYLAPTSGKIVYESFLTQFKVLEIVSYIFNNVLFHEIIGWRSLFMGGVVVFDNPHVLKFCPHDFYVTKFCLHWLLCNVICTPKYEKALINFTMREEWHISWRMFCNMYLLLVSVFYMWSFI